MIGWVRRLWLAASTPQAFFADRVDDDAKPLRALLVALGSGSVGAVVAGWALALATGSAPLVLVLAAVGLSLPYLVLITTLGGLALVRPGRLDLHAWEIAGWSWLPAAFLGLALAPVVPLAPAIALAVGVLILPAANMFMVHGGLRAFAPPDRVRMAFLVYVVVVYIAPALFTGITFWVVNLAVGS